jgi:hypothetical protein
MRSSKKKPRDLNKLAAAIVADATDSDGARARARDGGKNPAAVALGRLGGIVGGRARAAALTAEERSEIAKKAARVRWEREKKS